MQISADFVTWFDKFFFQLKALQKRVQKDVNRFIVPQAVPEIYRKNERLKNRGMCFFVIDCNNVFLTDYWKIKSTLHYLYSLEKILQLHLPYYDTINEYSRMPFEQWGLILVSDHLFMRYFCWFLSDYLLLFSPF